MYATIWKQEIHFFPKAEPQDGRDWLLVTVELEWSIQSHAHLNDHCFSTGESSLRDGYGNVTYCHSPRSSARETILETSPFHKWDSTPIYIPGKIKNVDIVVAWDVCHSETASRFCAASNANAYN